MKNWQKIGIAATCVIAITSIIAIWPQQDNSQRMGNTLSKDLDYSLERSEFDHERTMENIEQALEKARSTLENMDYDDIYTCQELLNLHDNYIYLIHDFIEGIGEYHSIDCTTIQNSTKINRTLDMMQTLKPYPEPIDRVIDCNLGDEESISFSTLTYPLKYIASSLVRCKKRF